MELLVKVIDTLEQRDFAQTAHDLHIQNVGKIGKIIHQKSSHGLCYLVAFDDKAGNVAWYDPDELTLTR